MLNLAHKNLEVYKQSLQLTKEIYSLTSKFPLDEKFGLTSQIKRAAISVNSNIAEGSSRKSILEKKRFYEISKSSLVEIDTQVEAALLLNFIVKDDLYDIENLIISVFKMLTGLINKT